MRRYLFTVVILFLLLIDNALLAQKVTGKPISVARLVDTLSIALHDNYIFPDKSKAISAYLSARLRQKIYKDIVVPEKLAAQLQQDIYSIHRDPHLRVYYEPAFVPERLRPGRGPRQPLDSTQLRQEVSNNFSFKRVEILNGNIGYVEFSGFSGFIDQAKPAIYSAFRFVANTTALIIDLRNNGGGSPWMVKHIASYLVSERTRLNDIYERRTDKTAEFWAEPEEGANLKLAMPVYILTSKHTFSAAEDFAYAMQVNKRAVIVGDTTGGGAHPTGPVSIGQGFVVDIPFARSINYITKTDWEGVGVLPDHACHANEALMKSQQFIFQDKIKNAKTNEEKAYFEWYVRSLDVRDYDNTITAEMLRTYAGTYETFKVFVKENKLYLDDPGGRTFLLKPISPTTFLGSDWFQVEFLTSDRKISKMKMMGKPGWVNIHNKVE